MAQIDITISDQHYDRLVQDLQALRNTYLDPLRVPLARILSHDRGRQKVRQWIANHPTEARLLVLVRDLNNYLDQWFDDILLEKE